jgi:SAM-dependent methyltransferase
MKYKNLIDNFFSNVDQKKIKDAQYLENYLIPQLGLNNENLNEQPQELSEYFGAGLGLRIWQYPNQFSKYLVLLSQYSSKINSYLEIGCRYGGTLVLHYEYLKSIGSPLNKVVSLDLIDASELMKEYQADGFVHLTMNSTSDEFLNYINNNFFDLIFIDGDHSYHGVKKDSENTEGFCNIKVFHDTVNDACPGTVEYWKDFQQEYKDIYNFYNFNDQYESVNGNFLGIGVAVRKKWITKK